MVDIKLPYAANVSIVYGALDILTFRDFRLYTAMDSINDVITTSPLKDLLISDPLLLVET
jgi:hypothetical protein